ncbi:hypothetical protein PGTUg99_034898 [Puccinia graminis f. sp. tritici]|uniref:Tet-like 2OG-Fe(II) oxygenase domain-containing protein n=1 Tax=Puccinia graminis f. sp. tritici TaxID=56615 RepID=A0A5B0RWZ2_PUCGR|nr:hypothetical protein PGTUg99_034898 [Puccinia graminis f. sp. tritici]
MTALRKAYLAERKKKNRSKKHAEEQTSKFSLTIDDTYHRRTTNETSSANVAQYEDPNIQSFKQSIAKGQEKITWSSKQYIKLKLFPHTLVLNPDRPPTDAEFKECQELTQNFKLFDYGKVVIHDKKEKSKIIAVIEFIPFNTMNTNELANINYVTQFLHSAKQFVNAVGLESRAWGGKMFAIGWRKSW